MILCLIFLVLIGYLAGGLITWRLQVEDRTYRVRAPQSDGKFE